MKRQRSAVTVAVPAGYRRRSQYVTKAQLKRALKANTELKYFCRSEEDLAVDGTTGIVRDLSLVAQGDDDDDRDGTVISAKWLVLRGRFGNADSAGNVLRIIVARVFGEGSAVGPTDFPQQSGTTTMGPFACWSSKKLNLKVLHDQLYKTDTDDPNTIFDIKMPVNAKINYASSATASATHNALILFVVSDSSVAMHPTISFTSQLSLWAKCPVPRPTKQRTFCNYISAWRSHALSTHCA